jgi:hypothetical protein
VILALRSRADDPRIRRALETTEAQLYTVKHNSTSDMRRVLRHVLAVMPGTDEELLREAVSEAEHAIRRVMGEGVAVALSPRTSELRKMQHRLVSRYHLEAVSVGHGPLRHLVIHPGRDAGADFGR